MIERVTRAADRVDHEDPKAGQDGIHHHKPDESPHPKVAALLPKRRRKDQIPGAEEHSEQGKPDDRRVLGQCQA